MKKGIQIVMFFEYVEYLNYCIEVGESPLVDQTDMSEYNAVNIMTVHGAKGLEFPVVFMINLVSTVFIEVNGDWQSI